MPYALSLLPPRRTAFPPRRLAAASRPHGSRQEAEAVLRDLAFALNCTRRVSAAIREGRPLPR